MVDYSRWDKIAADMSDSDKEEEDFREHGYIDSGVEDPTVVPGLGTGPFKVHKLNAPSRIHIEKGEVSYEAPPLVAGGSLVLKSSGAKQATLTLMPPSSSSSSSSATGAEPVPSQKTQVIGSAMTRLATTHGARVEEILPWSSLFLNGASHEHYCWTQDRASVTLYVLVPQGSRAKQVTVTYSGVSGASKCGEECPRHMRVCYSPLEGPKQTILDADMEYAVQFEGVTSGIPKHQMKVEEQDPDWEMLDVQGAPNACRVVKISSRKYQPFDRAVIWWAKYFKSEESIDTTKLQGRQMKSTENYGKLWKEAHEMFLKKVATREKMEV